MNPLYAFGLLMVIVGLVMLALLVMSWIAAPVTVEEVHIFTDQDRKIQQVYKRRLESTVFVYAQDWPPHIKDAALKRIDVEYTRMIQEADPRETYL